jgi:hypothetical protein
VPFTRRSPLASLAPALIGTGLLTCGGLLTVSATPVNAAGQEAEPWAGKLIAAIESQIGITLTYDAAYVGLAFPNGDIPRERWFAPMPRSEPAGTPSALTCSARSTGT